MQDVAVTDLARSDISSPGQDSFVATPTAAVAAGTFGSIQALRGIAALMVALFHAGLRLDPTGQVFRVGNAGVDIFFVISGFIMWTVCARRPTTPAAFLSNRFIRLVPLYWLMTLLMVGSSLAVPNLFPNLHFDAAHVLLSLAFLPHATPDGQNVPVLGQGWTLNFEVYFYLVFAVTLLLPARRRLSWIAVILLCLFVIGFLARPSEPAFNVMTNPLLLEFLGGVLVARLVAGRWRPAALWCWTAVALGVAGLWLLPPPAFDDDLLRLPLYGGPALLIVAGLVGVEVGSGLRVGRLPLLLGAASYSIYLTHSFAISVAAKLWLAALPPALFLAAAVPFAALVGIASFLLLERPLLGMLRAAKKQGVFEKKATKTFIH